MGVVVAAQIFRDIEREWQQLVGYVIVSLLVTILCNQTEETNASHHCL